jgi:hypothetical protein
MNKTPLRIPAVGLLIVFVIMDGACTCQEQCLRLAWLTACDPVTIANQHKSASATLESGNAMPKRIPIVRMIAVQ